MYQHLASLFAVVLFLPITCYYCYVTFYVFTDCVTSEQHRVFAGTHQRKRADIGRFTVADDRRCVVNKRALFILY